MRHNYDGLLATFDQVIKGFLNLMLTFSVKGRGCFVEKQDFRFANQGPCNCYSLFLASTQFDTSFSNHSFVAFWELSLVMDELVSVCLTTGIIDLRIDRSFISTRKVNTIANILSNRP